MRDHIRILGILNIAMGCLTALIGFAILAFMGGAAGLLNAGIYGEAEARVWAPFLAAMGGIIAVFFLILAAPSIAGGWGLMKYRPWARMVIIIVSILHLLNFPFGTALGVYGLWVLFSDQARRLFEGQVPAYIGPGSYPPPPNQPGPATYPPPPAPPNR